MSTELLTIAGVWQTLLLRWPLERIRADQAVPEADLDKASGDQLKIEIGYGSFTIRIRLLEGYRLVTFWDVCTRPGDGGLRGSAWRRTYNQFLQELGQELAKRGIAELPWGVEEASE